MCWSDRAAPVRPTRSQKSAPAVFLLLAFLRKRWPMGFWKRLKMVAPKALRFAAKPKASGPLPKKNSQEGAAYYRKNYRITTGIEVPRVSSPKVHVFHP